MKKNHLLYILLLLFLSGACTEEITTEFHAGNLRCEYMKEAVVSKSSPRFSWELVSSQNWQWQTAWQLIVSDQKEKIEAAKGNVWDSGKKEGNQSFSVQWQGDRLESFTKYYWKVRVWDRDGKVSNWSETASFITGSFDQSDWSASWIGDRPEPPLDYPLQYKHIGYLSAFTDNGSEEKWVQIDLGRIAQFDKIRAYPSHNNIRQIEDYYFPLACRIELSRDGDTWETVAGMDPAWTPGGDPVDISLGDVQGRYLRFVATKLQRYDHRIYDYEDKGDPEKMFAFSLAELDVIGNDKVLSAGCKVTYRDALIKIDREDGYDPDMLTDGITITPPYPESRPIPPSPLLRKSFQLKAKPVRAIAYVSALGVYDLMLNARSPDERVLAPEWTDYHKRPILLEYSLPTDGTPVCSGQPAGVNIFPKEVRMA
jgi:alpha-L-rhamnosidase